MTINNPFILDHSAVAMLGSVDSVDFGTAAAVTIYTVPIGKKCVLDHCRIRNVSGNMKTVVITIGQVGALTDFLGSQTLVNVDTAAMTVKIQPVPIATPVDAGIGVEYTAGEVLQIDVATASGDGAGTPTATVEFFGTLDDA